MSSIESSVKQVGAFIVLISYLLFAVCAACVFVHTLQHIEPPPPHTHTPLPFFLSPFPFSPPSPPLRSFHSSLSSFFVLPFAVLLRFFPSLSSFAFFSSFIVNSYLALFFPPRPSILPSLSYIHSLFFAQLQKKSQITDDHHSKTVNRTSFLFPSASNSWPSHMRIYIYMCTSGGSEGFRSKRATQRDTEAKQFRPAALGRERRGEPIFFGLQSGAEREREREPKHFRCERTKRCERRNVDGWMDIT